MKHLIRRLAAMVAVVVMVLAATGCAASRQKEIRTKLAAEDSVARGSEVSDTMGTEARMTGIVRSLEEKGDRMTLAVKAQGIAAESATLEVTPGSLLELPEGAGYSVRNGRAGVSITREGDKLVATGMCDSIARMCMYYRDVSEMQRSEIDSLEEHAARWALHAARQEAELMKVREEAARESEKTPGAKHWPWVVAGMVAGAAGAAGVMRVKDKITTKIKHT